MEGVTVWNVFSAQSPHTVGSVGRETVMAVSPLAVFDAIGQEVGRAEWNDDQGAWEICDAAGDYLGKCYGFLDKKIYDADDYVVGYSLEPMPGSRWKSDVQIYLLEPDGRTLQDEPIGHLNMVAGDNPALAEVASAAALLLLLYP